MDRDRVTILLSRGAAEPTENTASAALEALDGVERVQTAPGRLDVEYIPSRVSLGEMKVALVRAGFDVEFVPQDEEAGEGAEPEWVPLDT